MTDDLTNGAEGAGEALMSALKSKEVLVPAALSAAGAVAAAKGPDLVHKLTDAGERKRDEQAEDIGSKALGGAKKALGQGGFAGKMLSKAMPGGGGDGGGGQKKTRRLPIQRWTDVAVPVAKAYDAWNDFEKFPKYMHRVLSVEKKGNDRVSWSEKIWFSKRQWEGEITERRKNDRIAWKTKSGMSHRGVISFHPISENLTRVMVDIEFEPTGMVEKMASGMRFAKRAVQSDLARFKAYVEMEDAKGIEYRSGDDEGRSSNRQNRERGRRQRRTTSKTAG